MSDLRFNTIAGTVLAAGLLVMGLRTGAEILFHPQYPEKLPLTIAAEEAPAAGGGAAEAVDAGPPDFGRLFADEAQLTALVAQGEKVHKVCLSCHSDTPDSANKTGPGLYGVFGRMAGSHAGFKYSEAMKAVGKPWSYDTLYGFLQAPGSYVKGTAMSFAGIKKSEDRIAVIAYLRTLSPSLAALPAPLPQAAAAPPEAAAEAPAAAPGAPAAPAAAEEAPAKP